MIDPLDYDHAERENARRPEIRPCDQRVFVFTTHVTLPANFYLLRGQHEVTVSNPLPHRGNGIYVRSALRLAFRIPSRIIAHSQISKAMARTIETAIVRTMVRAMYKQTESEKHIG